MKSERQLLLAIIIIVITIISVNCVSGEYGGVNISENHSNTSINATIVPSVTPNDATGNFAVQSPEGGYDDYTLWPECNSTNIELLFQNQGKRTLTIREASASNVSFIVRYPGGKPVKFDHVYYDTTNFSTDEQYSYVLARVNQIYYDDSNTTDVDVILYLPSYMTYNIELGDVRVNIGKFQSPVIINVNGKVVLDQGPVVPRLEPELPDPTRLIITTQKVSLLVGGEATFIYAQLYYKGEPLRKKGVNITFSSSHPEIASLPRQINISTNKSGCASIILASNMSPGSVEVSAYCNGSNGVVTNSTDIDVRIWGNIGGLVRDKNDYGPPNANVSLWSCHYNSSSGKWDKDDLLDIPENPQLSNDGRTGPSGQFTFYRVPVGTYILMAEKEGYSNVYIVTLEPNEGVSSTTTAIIRIPDYAYGLLQFNQTSIPPATLNGGTIWGIVDDQNKVSIPCANVSLWHCEYNMSTKQWDKTTMIDVLNNPQRAGDGKTISVGEYRFDNLSQGTYYVMANYKGFYGHAIVHLNTNLATAYVVLPAPGCPPALTPSPTDNSSI